MLSPNLGKPWLHSTMSHLVLNSHIHILHTALKNLPHIKELTGQVQLRNKCFNNVNQGLEKLATMGNQCTETQNLYLGTTVDTLSTLDN